MYNENQNYYLERNPRILKEFNAILKAAKNVLSNDFDANTLQTILQEMRTQFENLIPKIPYIGGDENLLTRNLLVCAEYLPICKVLQQHNFSYEQIAAAVTNICKTQLANMPFFSKLGMRFLWKLMFSQGFQKQMRKDAKKSQEKIYPDSFVYEFVDGDGITFNFGFDFSDCAICHFFAKEGAAEFVPIMCELDYVLADFVGVKLNRTATIALGKGCCNFRYNKTVAKS